MSLPGGANPYAWAWRAEGRRRRVSWADRLGGMLPLVAAVVALPLWGEVLHDYQGFPEAARHEQFLGLVARLGLVMAALLGLGTYSMLVRGPERRVLELNPLNPGAWWRAKMQELLLGRLIWLLVPMVLMAPLWRQPALLGLAAAVLSGAWLAGLGVGALVNLAAPRAARTPWMQGTLDAIRGMNPREHAALIYAPGISLGLAGLAVVVSVQGAGAWLSGRDGAWMLLVPHLVGLGCLLLSRRLARSIEVLPALLGDIEAAWGQLEDAEESRRVYLEWLAERAPASLGREMLKDLRHGWRNLRAWISGAWLLGLATAVASAGEDPARGLLIGAVGVVVVGGLGVLLAARDPAWLDHALPVPRGLRAAARTIVLVAWSVPVVMAGIFGGFEVVFRLLILSGLVGGAGALLGLRLRARGWPVYAAVALVLVALVVTGPEATSGEPTGPAETPTLVPGMEGVRGG